MEYEIKELEEVENLDKNPYSGKYSKLYNDIQKLDIDECLFFPMNFKDFQKIRRILIYFQYENITTKKVKDGYVIYRK